MVTEAKWAYGTALMKGAVAIAELTNINGLDLDSDEIDVTNHDSPDGFEEVIRTIKRTGVVSLEGNFVPGDAGQAALMADYLTIDGAPSAYTIDFGPVGMDVEWNFTAFVKKAPSTEAPVEGKIPFSAELRVTGAPTLDIGYSGDITTIALSSGTLVPAYSSTVYEYVAADAAGATIDITVTDAGPGVLTIDGQVVGTGDATPVSLGAIGNITTFVVARKEEGEIPRRYKIHVARAS